MTSTAELAARRWRSWALGTALLALCLVPADRLAGQSRRAALAAESRPPVSSDRAVAWLAKRAAADDEEKPPFASRQKAPSLDGGEWINTAGPIDLKELRGKFVLLDFWTYCCINCMHILPELKKLEQAYPNELVVIGVHSAKFASEKDSKNITRGRDALRNRTPGGQRCQPRDLGELRRAKLADVAC